MKNFVRMNLISICFTLAGAATLAQASDVRPTSPLEVYGCHQPVTVPVGTNCYNGTSNGQLSSEHPLEATVTSTLLAGVNDGRTQQMTAKLTIQKITDSSDFYHDLGSVSIVAAARICSYSGGDCYYSQVNNTVTMNRVFGQRYFTDSPTFDVSLSEALGDDGDQYLTEIDLWLPNQPGPIAVRF